jgi:flavin reductase (DIM6/NTAB) family NADH-FMN oxidoreductase RutF
MTASAVEPGRTVWEDPGTFDANGLKDLYAHIPTCVVVVGAVVDGRPDVMVASSFLSVSIDPPIVGMCILRRSRTWERMREVPRFGISLLAAEHAGIVRSMASREGDRLAEVETAQSESGAILVRGASLWLEAALEQIVPAGDHVLVFLRVYRTANFAREPLVYHDRSFLRLADRPS